MDDGSTLPPVLDYAQGLAGRSKHLLPAAILCIAMGAIGVPANQYLHRQADDANGFPYEFSLLLRPPGRSAEEVFVLPARTAPHEINLSLRHGWVQAAGYGAAASVLVAMAAVLVGLLLLRRWRAALLLCRLMVWTGWLLSLSGLVIGGKLALLGQKEREAYDLIMMPPTGQLGWMVIAWAVVSGLSFLWLHMLMRRRIWP